MDALKDWAICLIIGAAAATLVVSVSPRGSVDKTVRAVVGIFVVAAICTPLAKLLKTDFSAENFGVYDFSVSEAENMKGYVLDIYKNEIQKRVISAAEDYGVTIEKIFISADIDAEGCIIIHKISIETDEPELAESSDFLRFVSQKTGFDVTVID